MSDDNIKIMSTAKSVNKTLKHIEALVKPFKFPKEIKQVIVSTYTTFMVNAALDNALRDVAGQEAKYDANSIKQDMKDLMRAMVTAVSEIPTVDEERLKSTMESLNTIIVELAASFSTVKSETGYALMRKKRALELRIESAPDDLMKLKIECQQKCTVLDEIDTRLSLQVLEEEDVEKLTKKRNELIVKITNLTDRIHNFPAMIEASKNSLADVNHMLSIRSDVPMEDTSIISVIERDIEEGLARLEIDDILTYDVLRLPRAIVLTRYEIPVVRNLNIDDISDMYTKLRKYIIDNAAKFENFIDIVNTSSDNIYHEISTLECLARSGETKEEDFTDSISNIRTMINQLSSLVKYNES